MNRAELARHIDHTLLKPDAIISEIELLCEEAVRYEFASVCVAPYYVNAANRLLAGSPVKTCTVVGFPFGYATAHAKSEEAKELVAIGADEIDMVINVCALKSGHDEVVFDDVSMVVDSARQAGKAMDRHIVVKVIMQTDLLDNQQKVQAARIIEKAGADYVKTNTGFTTGSVTIEDIKLIKSTVSASTLIKASGGIRTTQQALDFIYAGANRIGTSSGVAIIEGLKLAIVNCCEPLPRTRFGSRNLTAR